MILISYNKCVWCVTRCDIVSWFKSNPSNFLFRWKRLRWLEMNLVGKPYAGKPHVRFDEGKGLPTGQPVSTLPVQSRDLFRLNRSDSNFRWFVWAESADSAAHSKHYV